MDEVIEDHTPYIITRSKGKPIVVMSLDDYNAMDETAYLLSSENNRKALVDSISEVEKTSGTPHELME